MHSVTGVLLFFCISLTSAIIIPTRVQHLRGWTVISSAAKLKILAETEVELLSLCNSLELIDESNTISSFIRQARSAHDPKFKPLEEHPISQYLLVRRFAFLWPYIIQKLNVTKSPVKGNYKTIVHFYEKQFHSDGHLGFVGKAEVAHSTQRLTELHAKMRFPAAAWTNGSVLGRLSPSLKDIHLIEFASVALATNYSLFRYPVAAFWLSLLSPLPSTSSDIHRLLSKYPEEEQGQQIHETLDQLLDFLPYISGNRTVFDASVAQSYEDPVNQMCWEVESSNQQVWYTTEKKRQKLHCRYLNPKQLPFFPIRVEELLRNPRIMLFHDIIGPEACHEMKEAAKHHLRLHVLLTSVGRPAVIEDRMAQSMSLNFDHPSSQRVDSIISLATALTFDYKTTEFQSAENLTISNYGIAGSDRPRLDNDEYFSVVNGSMFQRAGKRLATILFHLSEVRSGGAIVFPRLGLGVKPRKGSAVMWDNISSGKLDERLQYASCVVSVGNKWTAQKWLRETARPWCTVSHGLLS